MELSDLHPLAVVFGIVGVVIGIVILKFGAGSMPIGIIWKVLIPIACGFGGWLIVQKMADSG